MQKLDILNSPAYFNPWPLHPQPLDGESLTSWLARIAKANVTTVPKLLSPHFGEKRWDRRDLDLLEERKVSILTHLGKVREGKTRVRKMVLTRWKKLLPLAYADRKGPITSISTIRYCPLCLSQDKIPYLRLVWRLHFVAICPQHNVVLQTGCWRCKNRFQPIINFEGVCVRCRSALGDAPVTKLNNCKYLIRFVSSLSNILDNGKFPDKLKWSQSIPDFFKVLLFLIRFFQLSLPRDKSWEKIFRDYELPRIDKYDWRNNTYVSCILVEKSLQMIGNWPESIQKLTTRDQDQVYLNRFSTKYNRNIPRLLESFIVHVKKGAKRKIAIQRFTNSSTRNAEAQVKCAVEHLLKSDLCPYTKTISRATRIYREKLKQHYELRRIIQDGIDRFYNAKRIELMSAINVLQQRGITITITALATYLGRSPKYVKKLDNKLGGIIRY